MKHASMQTKLSHPLFFTCHFHLLFILHNSTPNLKGFLKSYLNVQYAYLYFTCMCIASSFSIIMTYDSL